MSSLLDKGVRYEADVEALLGPFVELLYYDATVDYQGNGDFMALRPDGMLVAYGWSHGSCSGCDSWEDAPAGVMESEIKAGAQVMEPDVAVAYLRNRSPERYAAAIERCMALAEAHDAKVRRTDFALASIADALKGGTP